MDKQKVATTVLVSMETVTVIDPVK